MLKKSTKNQMVERRLSPRKRLQAMVKVVKKKEDASEETLNYSLTGLFLKCNLPEKYNINDQIEISFKDGDGANQVHIGQIVRKSWEGVAIHYQKKTDD
ncbi:MAG: PilZ domain-containing protein [Desulfobacula sp.]|uniref:PilZ domain-containing protein n=1 Tax=Desulfobacula sp. TaxID=2593537 RepID=UPI0025BD15E8|nr:PilZ domain-containing protein [Desulfobacula sp.]MCD4718833.1 PilZ domain-containing protein [Desulfobacula sp.]